MHSRKLNYLIPVLAGLFILAGLFLLWPAEDASAQCGSQASSCKNCHEVQGQDPVNNDGTGWHVSHAFGDFCYICHGGNNQSMDQDEAHTGMVPPLSDVQAGCASCHPADLSERAEVYAAVLGVEVGMGGGSNTPAQPSGSQDASAAAGESSSQSSPPAMMVASSDVIDYNQRYAETVLGQRQMNWGNVILSLMIVMVAVGGGGFVYWNERRRRGLPLIPANMRPSADSTPRESVQIEGYPDEVAALLPKIARLNPVGLHALKKLLENPDQASELLHSLSRLDPDLVRSVRSLDRESKALLLALSGD